jgi:tetratricopeptide (TPR) repeat protein
VESTTSPSYSGSDKLEDASISSKTTMSPPTAKDSNPGSPTPATSQERQNLESTSPPTTNNNTHHESNNKITQYDSDNDSDGYHRYDDDATGNYVKFHPQDQGPDPVIEMAMQASQETLLPSPKTDIIVKATPPKQQKEPQQAFTLDKKGKDLYKQGQLEMAAKTYREALQMKRASLRGGGDMTSKTDNDTAERTTNTVGQRARMLASMATSINNVAYLQQVNKEASPEQTLASYETALEIKRQILGPQHLSVGKTLNNIGSVYYSQQKYIEAAGYYEEARDILVHNLGDHHLDVCTVTSNLGDVHCLLGQYQRAVNEYRSAVKLRWKILGRHDPKVVRLMEQIADLEIKIDRQKNASKNRNHYSPNLYNDNEDNEMEHDGSNSTDDENDEDDPLNLSVLKSELQRDMEYFSSLQQSAAVDMIKDKTSVFREIRELTRATMSTDEEDSVVSSLEASSSPARARQQQQQMSRQDFLPPPKELNANFVRHPSLGTVSTVSSGDSRDRWHLSGTAESMILPQMSLAVERKESGSISIPGSIASSPPRNVSTATGSPGVRKPLSPQERKKALSSVQERLNRIRASRNTSGHQSTQDSSISANPSARLDMTPSKLFTTPTVASAPLLRPSEVLTIKQGIDALRESGPTASIAKDSICGANSSVFETATAPVSKRSFAKSKAAIAAPKALYFVGH